MRIYPLQVCWRAESRKHRECGAPEVVWGPSDEVRTSDAKIITWNHPRHPPDCAGLGHRQLAHLSELVVEEGSTDVKLQPIFRVACFFYDASF